MGILQGHEAVDYAERTGRKLFRRSSVAGGENEVVSPEEGRELADKDPNSVYLVLAYSGYVLSDREEILLQLIADNQYGFVLTDGEEEWPGGVGKAQRVMPVRESQVPPEIRQKLDPLRQQAGS